MTQAGLHVAVHLGPDDMRDALLTDALAGLTSVPKELPPKWFYDDRGSRLFDEITRLPEYYPTRREKQILVARAGAIATESKADTLIELGSGTSEKTRILLQHLADAGTLQRFVPFDVSEATLREAAAAILSDYPGIDVEAVVGDFEHHLELLPRGGTRMIAFLGGTIGNLVPEQRATMLHALSASMDTGDTFLLGTDLVKDVGRLEAAYDDAAGVTAEFNRNVLAVLNRELGATFDLSRFEHLARYDTAQDWIEMRLRSDGAQVVDVPGLEIEVAFADGEEMRTEISAKFRREVVEAELGAADLELVSWWTDSAGDFALSLARK